MDTLQDGVHLITSDVEALACLAFNGQTAAMLEAERFGMQPSFCGWQTERSYYAALHCQGYGNPADNGYVVLMIAKDNHTQEQALEIVAALLDNGRDQSGPCYFGHVELEPARN